MKIETISMGISVCSLVCGLVSALCWAYSGKTISREQEIARRQKKAEKMGTKANLAGVELGDGYAKYDLGATLKHQSQWNRWGALFAAAAIGLQAITQWLAL